MEEKYVWTIALVVIFAGFLFTSVGNYSGRATYNQWEGASYACTAGQEWVTDQARGIYYVCADGQPVIKYCHPGEEAIQRVNGVVCSK